MAGQLQAKSGGWDAGAHQLHCSVLWMQRSEVMREVKRWVVGREGQSSIDYLPMSA